MAMWANVLSWVFSSFAPSFLPWLLPTACAEEEEVSGDESASAGNNRGTHGEKRTRCVSIGRPGGLEQLRIVVLGEGIATVGYNVRNFCPPPYTPPIAAVTAGGNGETIPSDCVVLANEYFSVNYADCTIRWGLYESAKKFVGWPIVPGFDVAGTIESIGRESENSGLAGHFKVGDRVFGCSLFGAYSSRVLVPRNQLRLIPEVLTVAQAAAIPAVSLTALYSLRLAGHYPEQHKFKNRSILIHSAAGGVGSMAVQMAKILCLRPVVGVVGSTTKVAEAKALGCDVVIDKSSEDLWDAVENASPGGYSAILDANGVSTLQDSYDHLAPAGRLIVFGFHSNLPMGRAMLSPLEWLRMAKKASAMPKFDPMLLTVENKSVLGFNLSFFADETEVLSDLFDQICLWLNEKKLRSPNVAEMDMNRIGDAHASIQSGKSVGKIVINTVLPL